jgi:uncharacterized membrane protein
MAGVVGGQSQGGGGRIGSAILTGVLLGIGIVGFLDETIFHQLLQWHSFYWHTDAHGRILSDGLFHALSTSILLLGSYRLWRDRSSATPSRSSAILAGILVGGGGFNTYDGVVQHVILHFHLVNEHVCPVLNADNSVATCTSDIPYEIAWIAVGGAVLVGGIVWWRKLLL